MRIPPSITRGRGGNVLFWPISPAHSFLCAEQALALFAFVSFQRRAASSVEERPFNGDSWMFSIAVLRLRAGISFLFSRVARSHTLKNTQSFCAVGPALLRCGLTPTACSAFPCCGPKRRKQGVFLPQPGECSETLCPAGGARRTEEGEAVVGADVLAAAMEKVTWRFECRGGRSKSIGCR